MVEVKLYVREHTESSVEINEQAWGKSPRTGKSVLLTNRNVVVPNEKIDELIEKLEGVRNE